MSIKLLMASFMFALFSGCDNGKSYSFVYGSGCRWYTAEELKTQWLNYDRIKNGNTDDRVSIVCVGETIAFKDSDGLWYWGEPTEE